MTKSLLISFEFHFRKCHPLCFHYVLVPPNWCAGKGACWEMMVDMWLSEEWIQRHNLCRERRLLMQGAPHHQGSRGLPEYRDVWVSHYTFWYFQTLNSAFSLIIVFFRFACSRGHMKTRNATTSRHTVWRTRAGRRPTSPTTRRIHPRRTATRASTRASLSTRRWERHSMGTHGIRPPSPFLEKPS